jgi:outer membrane biosynthesis protein TonB
VSKNAYPYPPDEFDQVDVNSRPKEVHAARRGMWNRVWPFLLVIVLVPAVAFLVVHFLADRLPGAGTASSPPPSTAGEVSATPVEPPADNTDVPPPTEPEVPPPTEPEAPPPDTPTETVDQSVTVTIHNNGPTRGAAATAAEQLKNAGFNNANFVTSLNDTTPASSTVYYSTDTQKAAADLIASTLSITAIELNPQVAGGNIVVVLK